MGYPGNSLKSLSNVDNGKYGFLLFDKTCLNEEKNSLISFKLHDCSFECNISISDWAIIYNIEYKTFTFYGINKHGNFVSVTLRDIHSLHVSEHNNWEIVMKEYTEDDFYIHEDQNFRINTTRTLTNKEFKDMILFHITCTDSYYSRLTFPEIENLNDATLSNVDNMTKGILPLLVDAFICVKNSEFNNDRYNDNRHKIKIIRKQGD